MVVSQAEPMTGFGSGAFSGVFVFGEPRDRGGKGREEGKPEEIERKGSGREERGRMDRKQSRKITKF